MKSLYNSAVPRVLILAGLLVATVLSGCVGGKGSGAPKVVAPTGGGSGGKLPDTTKVVDCAASGDAKACKTENDPRRHYHHYWGDPALPKVDIFYMKDIEIQQDPFKGRNEGCGTIGHREFDLETDENDAAGGLDEPINKHPQSGPNPKADVVFAGTVRIEIELLDFKPYGDTAADNVPAELRLQWKPANLNTFLPGGADNCGMKLEMGKLANIPVGPGGADPPHQFLVSRWAFKAWVDTPAGDNGAYQTAAANGKFSLRMTAINGGENSLDPAHPDLWAGKDVYDLGCHKEDNVPRQVVITTGSFAQIDRPPKEPLTNIEWEYGRIVPLKTQKVTGTLEYTNNAPAKGNIVVLYFGGDNNRYTLPDEQKDEGGKISFTIMDPQERKADPPYLPQTLWRFQIVPQSAVTQPDGKNVGVFEGNFNMCFQAHKIPDATIN